MAKKIFSKDTNAYDSISLLSDKPNSNEGLSSAQVKEKFDEAGNKIKTFINDTLLAELQNSTDGDSGAQGIGYDGVSVDNVADALDQIYSAGSGSIPPDGTISQAKLDLTLNDFVDTVSAGYPGLVARGGQMQLFESSGTFTLPAGVERIHVEVVGGGGGGQGMTNIGFGVGGGGGGYAYKIINADLITEPVVVTVGAGGAAGQDGGASSFGTFCSATGGVRGVWGIETSGAGGGGVGGDVNIYGGPGGEGFGGSSFYGGGANRRGSEGAGPSGRKYGGGGGGAYKSNNNQVGGAGAPGVVIVRW